MPSFCDCGEGKGEEAMLVSVPNTALKVAFAVRRASSSTIKHPGSAGVCRKGKRRKDIGETGLGGSVLLRDLYRRIDANILPSWRFNSEMSKSLVLGDNWQRNIASLRISEILARAVCNLLVSMPRGAVLLGS